MGYWPSGSHLPVFACGQRHASPRHARPALAHPKTLALIPLLGNRGGSGSRLPARQRKNKMSGRRSIQFNKQQAMTFIGCLDDYLAGNSCLAPTSFSRKPELNGSRTPQNPLLMLNTLSSVSVRESRIQYLCDPQWFRDTASRGPTTIAAPESHFRTCPSDHVDIEESLMEVEAPIQPTTGRTYQSVQDASQSFYSPQGSQQQQQQSNRQRF
ncbi:hypothetical protein F511_33180 [Dorcoceras hygrometricum]|uniref:Uncharacterized protein n=1 Tax=Dorcoceras hygrometricum TaxID=472368 RepID=A0A2Z7C3H1_9LAMI|nr:hypothetical protein F511_33180 [Dorcoceras hygrometricum]